MRGMAGPLSLAVRIAACTPELFTGQGAYALNSPPHPGRFSRDGSKLIRESRTRTSY
ncbi:MAG: hypothetical protein AW10_00035 [Candidatus Accumulibacter appositus]|uniref:Uncharacterized protein n=1 Tax=Candidatus Accumulibacter appositus TaxID=1454003 RepID=A0A011QWR2_9PROT|nr:MAG: hypothetical protein AW10_00035 [Candidatus Accumulibacter appositus]